MTQFLLTSTDDSDLSRTFHAQTVCRREHRWRYLRAGIRRDISWDESMPVPGTVQNGSGRETEKRRNP